MEHDPALATMTKDERREYYSQKFPHREKKPKGAMPGPGNPLKHAQFMHFRFLLRGEDGSAVIDNRGGATLYYKPVEDGYEVSLTVCEPGDNFSKKSGRDHAIEHMENHYVKNDKNLLTYAELRKLGREWVLARMRKLSKSQLYPQFKQYFETHMLSL